MVSDFIDEVGGYLRHGDQEARVLIEPQQYGYWESNGFLAQVNKAVDILEKSIHNYACGLFLFDNAPRHKKTPPDALNPASMNVDPGGKQPKMKPTTWNREVQKMCFLDGTLTGMKVVLE